MHAREGVDHGITAAGDERVDDPDDRFIDEVGLTTKAAGDLLTDLDVRSRRLAVLVELHRRVADVRAEGEASARADPRQPFARLQESPPRMQLRRGRLIIYHQQNGYGGDGKKLLQLIEMLVAMIRAVEPTAASAREHLRRDVVWH